MDQIELSGMTAEQQRNFIREQIAGLTQQREAHQRDVYQLDGAIKALTQSLTIFESATETPPETEG